MKRIKINEISTAVAASSPPAAVQQNQQTQVQQPQQQTVQQSPQLLALLNQKAQIEKTLAEINKKIKALQPQTQGVAQ